MNLPNMEIEDLEETVTQLFLEKQRLLQLAIKHCSATHPDFHEILVIAGLITSES